MGDKGNLVLISRVVGGVLSLACGALLFLQAVSLMGGLLSFRTSQGTGALLISVAMDNIFSPSGAPKAFGFSVTMGSPAFYAIVAAHAVVGFLLILLGFIALRGLKTRYMKGKMVLISRVVSGVLSILMGSVVLYEAILTAAETIYIKLNNGITYSHATGSTTITVPTIGFSFYATCVALIAFGLMLVYLGVVGIRNSRSGRETA